MPVERVAYIVLSVRTSEAGRDVCRTVGAYTERRAGGVMGHQYWLPFVFLNLRHGSGTWGPAGCKFAGTAGIDSK